jgi:hypothetical protein
LVRSDSADFLNGNSNLLAVLEFHHWPARCFVPTHKLVPAVVASSATGQIPRTRSCKSLLIERR